MNRNKMHIRLRESEKGKVRECLQLLMLKPPHQQNAYTYLDFNQIVNTATLGAVSDDEYNAG